MPATGPTRAAAQPQAATGPAVRADTAVPVRPAKAPGPAMPTDTAVPVRRAKPPDTAMRAGTAPPISHAPPTGAAEPVAAPVGHPVAVQCAPSAAAAAGTAGRRDALRRVVVPLAAVAVLAEVGYPLAHGPARAALTVGAVVVFCAASVGHAVVTRGWPVGAALVAVFAVGGWLTDVAGVATGVPFGRYSYGGSLGPAALGVPVVIGLAWCMAAWPAYVAAQRLGGRIPRPARVLLAAVALASWDLFLDPQMVAEGHWTWQYPAPALPGVAAVPLTNYAGWLLAALALMAAFELLAGPAAAGAGPDAVPLALYLWTYGSSVLAHAAFLGLPGSAVWGGVGMGLVAVPLAVTLRR